MADLVAAGAAVKAKIAELQAARLTETQIGQALSGKTIEGALETTASGIPRADGQADPSQTASTVPLNSGQPGALIGQAFASPVTQALAQGVGQTAGNVVNSVRDFTSKHGEIVGVVLVLLAIFWVIRKAT